MGLGSTAKKLQTLADTAEKLYSRMNELRSQLVETQETVRESTERLDRLESEMAEQRAVLDALAREQGLDVETISAEAHISEAEAAPDGTEGETDDENGSAGDADGEPRTAGQNGDGTGTEETPGESST